MRCANCKGEHFYLIATWPMFYWLRCVSCKRETLYQRVRIPALQLN
jgi:hypothetical protein